MVDTARLYKKGAQLMIGLPKRVADELRWTRGDVVLLVHDGQTLALRRFDPTAAREVLMAAVAQMPAKGSGGE